MPTLSSARALDLAVSTLRAEAAAFEQTHLLRRQEPDFAESYPHHISNTDVLGAIQKVQDEQDPIVDGYIRWQLLSFHPPIDRLKDVQIQQLCTSLPRLRESGADDTKLQQQFEQLAVAANKDPGSRQLLLKEWDKLQRRQLEDELFNLPSLKFREFILDNLAPGAARSELNFVLSDISDHVRAGIDTRSIKMKATKVFRKRMNDPGLTEDDRWMFIKLLGKMSQTENVIIRDVETASPGKPVKISYSTLGVRSTDVDRWSAYLNHHEP